MHPQQKAAWFTLIVFGGTVALYAASVPLISWWSGRPWAMVVGPLLGIFGLFGIAGCACFYYRAPKDGKPLLDERDHLLSMRAWRVGMVTFWELFVFASVGAWAFMRYVRGLDRVTLPVEFFPWMVFAAMIIFMVTQSLATLHYYGWRWHDASAA